MIASMGFFFLNLLIKFVVYATKNFIIVHLVRKAQMFDMLPEPLNRICSDMDPTQNGH